MVALLALLASAAAAVIFTIVVVVVVDRSTGGARPGGGERPVEGGPGEAERNKEPRTWPVDRTSGRAPPV